MIWSYRPPPNSRLPAVRSEGAGAMVLTITRRMTCDLCAARQGPRSLTRDWRFLIASRRVIWRHNMSMIPAHPDEPLTRRSGGHGEMSMRSLGPFLAIAFGLAWGLLALMILFTSQVEAMFGPVSGTNPLFILAVYAPGIAAILLVWWHYGTKGLAGFFRRLTLWRMPLGWWAFILIGIPAVKFLGAAINGSIGDPLPFSPWYMLLPALAITL